MPRNSNKQLEDATALGLAHSVAQALEPKFRALAMGEEQTRQLVEAMAPAIGQLIGELQPQIAAILRAQQPNQALLQSIASIIPPDPSRQLSRIEAKSDQTELQTMLQALALEVHSKPEAFRFEVVRNEATQLIEYVDAVPIGGDEDELIEEEVG